MSDESEFKRLIKENIRWKHKYREVLAERDSIKSQFEELQQQYDELDTEVTAYLKEIEENPVAETPSDLIEELNTYKRKEKLSTLQEAIDASGKFRKGVKAEQIAALRGLNMDEFELNDGFGDELLQWAQTDASILLDDTPVASSDKTDETTGGSRMPVAAKRLPTFSTTASGGGAALPASDPVSQAMSLRDPAAAIRRAVEARTRGAETPV